MENVELEGIFESVSLRDELSHPAAETWMILAVQNCQCKIGTFSSHDSKRLVMETLCSLVLGFSLVTRHVLGVPRAAFKAIVWVPFVEKSCTRFMILFEI